MQFSITLQNSWDGPNVPHSISMDKRPFFVVHFIRWWHWLTFGSLSRVWRRRCPHIRSFAFYFMYKPCKLFIEHAVLPLQFFMVMPRLQETFFSNTSSATLHLSLFWCTYPALHTLKYVLLLELSYNFFFYCRWGSVSRHFPREFLEVTALQ